MVGARDPVTRSIDLSEDELDVTFLVGQDLDEIYFEEGSDYCFDFGFEPGPVVDQTLTATGGSAEIVLHPTPGDVRQVRGDLTLDDVTFSDGETTVSGLSMPDASVGRHS